MKEVSSFHFGMVIFKNIASKISNILVMLFTPLLNLYMVNQAKGTHVASRIVIIEEINQKDDQESSSPRKVQS
jgi:hypothetical protein